MHQALTPRERELQAQLDRLQDENRALRATLAAQDGHATRAAERQELEALRALVDHAPDVIARYDRAYRHVAINRAVERATGRPAADFLGKSNAELGMPPDLVALWDAHIEAAFAKGEASETEFEFPSPQGPRRFQLRIVPEFGPDGRVASVMSISRDVTELVQVRADLADHQRKLAMIIEHATDPIYIKDREGRLLLINPAGSAVFGRSVAEVLGRRDDALFPPAVAAQVRAEDARVMAEGGVHTFEDAVPQPDGGVRTFLVAKFPYLGPSGEVAGVVGIARDITERKLMETVLREQKDLTTAIVEHAPAGICFIDRDLVYRWVNPAFLRLLGVDLAHMLDRRVEDAFPEGAEQIVPLHRQVLATGRPYHGVAFPWRYRVGDREVVSHWDFTYQPVFGPDEAVMGILVLAVEVSERVEKERLQAAQIDALQEADRLKDQFLGILSHELRTPLNFITGFASILEDGVFGALEDRQREAVGKILGGAERMLRLVNDLLDMTRIRAGNFALVRERLDLARTVRQALEDHAPAAAGKGLVLEAVDLAGLPAADADPARVAQVLDNLLANAVKFTPAGGAIAVRARVDGAMLRVEVADTGPGVAPEARARIFEPFMQADMTATREAGGVGLGLSIVRALVEAHGGTVGFEAPAAGGSVFWFTLPVAGEPRGR